MKKELMGLSLASLIFVCAGTVSANGPVMSVSPGELVNGGTVGLEMGPMGAYVGLDTAFFSLSGTAGSEDYTETMGVKGAVIAPSIGFKYNVPNMKKVTPYIKGSVSYLKPTAKVFGKTDAADAEALQAEIDGINKTIKESLDKVRFYAWRVGFGMESPVTETIFLSTELGIKGVNATFKDFLDIDGLDPETAERIETKIAAAFAGSYATIGITLKF